MREPKQKRSIEKKRKLITAGMKLFSEKGFHRTDIKSICAEAGVSVGSFYGYFKDKKQLLDLVAESYAGSIIKGVYADLAEGVSESMSGEEVSRHLVDSSKLAHSLSAELHREMLALKNREEHMAKLDRTIIRSFEQEIEKVLLGRSDLAVENAQLSSRMVAGAIEETMHRCLIEKTEPDVDRVMSELVNMCTAYLFKRTQP